MKLTNISKSAPLIVTISCSLIVIIMSAILYGAVASIKEWPPIPQVRLAYEALTGDLFKDIKLKHLQPSRNQGDGVTINKISDDNSMVMLCGFFDEENQIRLIKRDGTLLKKWPLDYFKHFPNPENRPSKASSPLHIDVHGALINPFGEVVFNYEYGGTVKLDQCGSLIWRLNELTHHSIVKAEKGGYWLLSRKSWSAIDEPGSSSPFHNTTNNKASEDFILKIGEDGEILNEISIPKLLIENNLEALLTAGKYYPKAVNGEIVHSNKVAELSSNLAKYFPLFTTGDIVVSLRKFSLIFVVDPNTQKIKWHQTGPWLKQHDPEFSSDGRISIFNNNVYRNIAYDANDHLILNTPFSTNIIAVDPVSRKTEVIYGESPGEKMLTASRGQHEILENGHILIIEFDAGRVFEIDKSGNIVWEYVNAYNDEFVGEITNANVYMPDYFQVDLKDCVE